MSKVQFSRRTMLAWTGAVAAMAPLAGLGGCQREYMTGEEPAGYGKDPPLMEPVRQPWPKIMTERQIEILSALIDVILPETDSAPAASQMGVGAFFEEWLSAPYPAMVADREMIMPFLANFTSTASTKSLVQYERDPAFERLRVLTAAAYYTAPDAEEIIGFGGNTPRTSFDGPPAEVLERFDQEYAKLK